MSVCRVLLAVGALLAGGANAAQDAESSLQGAVDAYREGDLEGAAQQLRALLAENPSQEEAYRLWQSVERDTITQMLLERGETGRLAERFLGLATLGRREVLSDPGEAEEVVQRLLAGDAIEREQAALELRARFGSWAVPALVGPLGDRETTENRVLAIQALVRLGGQAVLPLIEVLESDDPLTRRNAAAVLGTLRDRRAAAALAWMAKDDADPVARDAAAEALAKIGMPTSDPASLSAALADGYFRREPDLIGSVGTSTVVWEWQDGALVGHETLGGLAPLELAEGVARDALARGAGPVVRAILAATHAAQKAEIVAASQLPAFADDPLLEAAQARLPALDVALALAGSHRSRALVYCLSNEGKQGLAAQMLMAAMDGSAEERQALGVALLESEPGVSFGAALALARQGVTDTRIVEILGGTLAATPDRLVVSIGRTGLAGGTPGWTLLASDGFDVGLLRAKSLPPKHAIVVEEGLQDLTLDTLVFAFKNDPRSADVPLIIVARDPAGVEELYGDKVAKIVESASFADVQEVAGEPEGAQREALDRARMAAEALARMPASVVRGASGRVASALEGTDDAGVRIAILGLAGSAGLLDALPAVETFVLDDSLDTEVRAAALRAAGRLWALNAGSRGDPAPLSEALAALVGGGDEALRLPAAEALGQLKNATDREVAGLLQ